MNPIPEYPFQQDILEYCSFSDQSEIEKRKIEKYSCVISRFIKEMHPEISTCSNRELENWIRNNLTNKTSLYVKDLSRR